MAPHFGGLAALGTRGTQTKFGRAWSGEMRCHSCVPNKMKSMNNDQCYNTL